MKSPLIHLLLYVCAIVFCGCESKYVEKPPTEVKMHGPSVETRAEQKVSIDQDLVRFQKSMDKVSGLVNQIGVYLASANQTGFFSLIQIANNSLKELKEGMPQYYSDELFARYSSIKLSGVAQDACGSLDVALTTYPLMKIQGNVKAKLADRFGIFVKSCLSEEQYKPLFFIDSYPQKINIRFVQKNLKFVHADLESNPTQAIPQCNINFGDKAKIASIECTDIFVRIDETHSSLIKSLKFTPDAKVVVTALIATYQNNSVVDQGSILTIDNLGQIKTTTEISHEK